MRASAVLLLVATAACGVAFRGGEDDGDGSTSGVSTSAPSSSGVGASSSTGASSAGGGGSSSTGNGGTAGSGGMAGGGGGVGAATPFALASTQNTPDTVVVDDTHVYFTSTGDGSVSKVAKTGGNATILANEGGNPKGLAVDGTHVYWAVQNADTLWRVPIGGGTAEIFAASQPSVRHVALTASDVYWTTYTSPGAVMRKSKVGGTATSVASGQDLPAALTLDATHLYWTNGGTGDVMRCAIASCTPEIVGIIADAGTVFMAVRGTPDRIVGVPIGGGTPTVLADDQSSPAGIAQDDAYLYWANASEGTLMKLAKP